MKHFITFCQKVRQVGKQLCPEEYDQQPRKDLYKLVPETKISVIKEWENSISQYDYSIP